MITCPSRTISGFMSPGTPVVATTTSASRMGTLMREADVVVATTGVPGLIKPEMVRAGQVILAITNPYPEIEPEDALAVGAAFAAGGKSVKNVLGYPRIF